MEINVTEKSNQALKDTSTYEVRDISHVIAKDHKETLLRAINAGMNTLKGDFWVEIQHFKDHLVSQENAIRIRPVVCAVCPVPTINHSVYRYYRVLDTLIHLWTVPSLDMIDYLKGKRDIPEDYMSVAQQVKAYLSKSLDKICMEQNKDVNRDDVAFVLKNKGKKLEQDHRIIL